MNLPREVGKQRSVRLKAIEELSNRRRRIGKQGNSFTNNLPNHLNQLAILREITLAITSTLQLPKILDRLLDHIDRRLPYDASTVRLLDGQGFLKPLACHNIDMIDWAAGCGEGLVKEMMERKAPVISVDVQADPRSRGPDFFRKYGFVSFIGVPLIIKNRIIGVLSLYTKTTHHFTRDETNFLSTLAGQVAIAIHNSQLYEKAKQHQVANAAHARRFEKQAIRSKSDNQFLGALQSISSLASRSLNLDAMLKEVIQRVTEIFGFDATRIFIIDRNRNELLLNASFETDSRFYLNNTVFCMGQGILGKVAETGRPLLFTDIFNDPEYWKLSHSKTNLKAGLRFFAVFPIKIKSRIVGCIDFSERNCRQLTQSELRLIKSMVSHLAMAVENANLFAATKQKVEELTTLYSLARVLNSSLNFEVILRRIMDKVLTMLPFDAGRVYLFDRDTDNLRVLASRHYPTAARAKNIGLLGRVIQEKRPLYFEDIQTDLEYRRWASTQLAHKAGFRSGFYVPVKAKGEIVGILSFLGKKVHRFLPYETQLIDCLVNQLGTALENAQIYEAMERSQRQLRSLAEKLQLAREEERARLARRLHDEMGQALAGLKMKLDAYAREGLNDPNRKREYEKELFGMIDAMVKTLRRMGRDLRPQMLNDMDIAVAIQRYAREFEKRTGIHCRLKITAKQHLLNQPRAIAVLRIYQEALSNVQRHSGANQVDIAWTQGSKGLSLRVHDNGKGIRQRDLRHTESLGIIGMRERALLCGGRLEITRKDNIGTFLSAHIPIRAGAKPK